MRKILYVRLDRIGDLTLTLPVDQSHTAKGSSHWWISRGLGFILDHSWPRRTYEEVPKNPTFLEFWGLVKALRQAQFDAAIVFHAPWWTGLALCLARVPVRGGPRSQWHSFLFYNRGLRQKRSRAELHELEYNYRLAESAFSEALPRAHLELRASDLSALSHFTPKAREYFVVHPGMGGSAQNWPMAHYASLIAKLAEQSHVVITGTAQDAKYLQELKPLLRPAERIHWLDGRLSGPELLAVLGSARGVCAPSTGVIHLAASLGVVTLGLYSPVRVQHPRRWGPKGNAARAMSPQVECPGELACLGPRCAQYNCMSQIQPDDVLQRLTHAEGELK